MFLTLRVKDSTWEMSLRMKFLILINCHPHVLYHWSVNNMGGNGVVQVKKKVAFDIRAAQSDVFPLYGPLWIIGIICTSIVPMYALV